jgi:hypothetical protein
VLVYAYMREESVVFPSFKLSSAIALVILTIGTLILGILPLYSWDLALKATGSFLLTFQAK